MDFNKDIAMRTKWLAEDKFTEKDFVGARKLAQKAKDLFPGLSFITLFITIIDIYISREIPDWYGVVGLEYPATLEQICEKYFNLHHDIKSVKDNVIGAQVALEILSEAFCFLTNTFWTECPGCLLQFQYSSALANKNLKCFNCSALFLAVKLPPAIEQFADLNTMPFQEAIGRLKAFEERMKKAVKEEDGSSNLLFSKIDEKEKTKEHKCERCGHENSSQGRPGRGQDKNWKPWKEKDGDQDLSQIRCYNRIPIFEIMDFNKDIAMRTKWLAEDKFTEKDFVGARKVAQKAKDLFPGLSFITLFITIIDIYISREIPDWYGVVGLEYPATLEQICEKYFNLHHDIKSVKDNVIGAQVALEILSEAFCFLTNTFWTECPGCLLQFQYSSALANKNLKCFNCSALFLAVKLPPVLVLAYCDLHMYLHGFRLLMVYMPFKSMSVSLALLLRNLYESFEQKLVRSHLIFLINFCDFWAGLPSLRNLYSSQEQNFVRESGSHLFISEEHCGDDFLASLAETMQDSEDWDDIQELETEAGGTLADMFSKDSMKHNETDDDHHDDGVKEPYVHVLDD
ncbi:hypothetical protein CTI12_AA346220 [Artemisia annua]|uniref:Zinc beta-ribbon domain-containing protein n=1 Tax=Artemisia annua TaxID=35608 RepID=A0A2U1MSM4_ARTAN|nr:hypothetical protein CTI12_AA346220 [Artemisia annua]